MDLTTISLIVWLGILLENGLGILSLGILAFGAYTFFSRPKGKRNNPFIVILVLTAIILAVGQNMVGLNIRNKDDALQKNAAQDATFDVYVPTKSIGGSHKGTVSVQPAGDGTTFTTFYTSGPLDVLYESSVAYAAVFGTNIPLNLYDCDIARHGETDPECKNIGTAQNGASIYVDSTRYVTHSEHGYNAMSKYDGTFVAITLKSYVSENDIVGYFNGLKKTSAGSLNLVDDQDQLLLFPVVKF